ncbi:MAG: FHA domain-containing protein [Planctomycetes bacterium]|nr:FHA domain-containing protein [Planctomycetota bacterium]MCB9917338.1 FHA domain-containing protein [Planctomycetota bacterium]
MVGPVLQIELESDGENPLWLACAASVPSAEAWICVQGEEGRIELTSTDGSPGLVIDEDWQTLHGMRIRVVPRAQDLSLLDRRAPRPPELHASCPGSDDELRFVLSLEEGRTWDVGRKRGLQLRLCNRKVSQQHLRLWVESGSIHVEDYTPTWPTRLRGKKLEGRLALRHGDVLEIGECIVRFVDPVSAARDLEAKQRAEEASKQRAEADRHKPNRFAVLGMHLRRARRIALRGFFVVALLAAIAGLLWITFVTTAQEIDVPRRNGG